MSANLRIDASITLAIPLAFALTIASQPAQADIVGSIVNSVVGAILNDTLNQTEPEAPDHRDIPTGTQIGVMWPPRGRLTAIDGKNTRLSPGCQIRDHHNRIIRPGTIRTAVRVRYVRNANRDIHRVWILGRATSADVEISASK